MPQTDIAALAAWLLYIERPFILHPGGTQRPQERPSLADGFPHLENGRVGGSRVAWAVGLFSSGSTRSPRAYGFTIKQLRQLAAWYTGIYGVTSHSVVVTHLPVAYNFAFVAGLFLAGALGARLHLVRSPFAAFGDAASLAKTHDRVVILGNPVLLASPPEVRLPGTVMIDSGGAPLSTTAIGYYRDHVADLREGYGLTETGSLTHFDSEGRSRSLGTVGTSMPGIETAILTKDGKPQIALSTPALGIALGEGYSNNQGFLLTEDLGTLDSGGRLRILGRSDDYQINGLWPRDTLDIAGEVLGTATALVRHPSESSIHLRLRESPGEERSRLLRKAILERVSGYVELKIDTFGGGLLHSHKLSRHISPFAVRK